MAKDLSQGCLHLAPHLHSLRCQFLRSSFLIVATSRDQALLSCGVTVALANKTARIIWAVMASGEVYRPEAAA